jgi:two-component system, OmpR family, sensor histidine kinase MprB
VSFRARIALASALAVAIAVGAVSVVSYVLVRDRLESSLDRSLRGRMGQVRGSEPHLEPNPAPLFGGPEGATQLVLASGRTIRPPGSEHLLPVSKSALAVAKGEHDEARENATVEGVRLRILTIAVRDGVAVQVARPRNEVDETLARTRNALLFVGIGGVVLAGLLGLLVSRAAIGPLARLTGAAEEIAETRDLSRRVGGAGTDEVGRLAGRFDAMLAALEGSQQAQRALVADASHELRTPIATVRTNVDLLTRHPDLPSADRDAALATARSQLEELSALVTDIVELARDGTEAPPIFADFRLDDVVGAAVERARIAHPELTFVVNAEAAVVNGAADRVQRAVSNLLDNAAKWSPSHGQIEVEVTGTRVTVTDHGPGIDPDDRAHVFDRFYRASAARSLQGSGLGLAIVRQVAVLHGGETGAEETPGGGATVYFTLAE